MTASEIADRYRQGPATDLRLQKAQALATRSNVSWLEVQAILDRPMVLSVEPLVVPDGVELVEPNDA